MSSSLILGPFDLLDPASAVVLQPGFDRGAPSPTVSVIQSAVLDGAAVTGRAAGNRNIVLPLVVRAPDRVTAATLANQVLSWVDQASWPLTFTPDGGFPVVYDCYRAASVIAPDLVADAQGWQGLSVQCEALPYGRSPDPQTVALSGGSTLIQGFEATPEPATITATRGTFVSKSRVGVGTVFPVTGSFSMEVDYKDAVYSPGSAAALTMSNSATLAAGFTGPQSVAKVWIRFGSVAGLTPLGSWALTLTTDAGSFVLPPVFNPSLHSVAWGSVTFDASAVTGTTVTGWTLKTPTLQHSTRDTATTQKLYVDDLRLYPAAVAGVSSPRGGMYTLSNVLGTARTPINVAVAPSSGSLSAAVVHIPPGDTPSAQPLIPLAGGTSGVAYTTPAGVAYEGTYSVWLVCAAISGSGSRTWTVSFNQSSLPGGVSAVSVANTGVFGPGVLTHIGEITLPILESPAEAQPTTTVTVTSSAGGDTFNDVLLLDTRGSTVLWQNGFGSAGLWIDEPAPSVAFGGVWYGAARSSAYSGAPTLSAASTLLADPGDTQILLYDVGSAPSGTVTYSPRWLQEATS